MAIQLQFVANFLHAALDRVLRDEEAFITELEQLVAWYRAKPRAEGELRRRVYELVTEVINKVE